MTCIGSIHRIVNYFLFVVLILCHQSFAQDEMEQSLENEEGFSGKPPRRHLLYSSYSSDSNAAEVAIYIFLCIVLSILWLCCKFCIKQQCQTTDDYSDAVVHPPPRQNYAERDPPSSGRVLLPPRSSGSIILPSEGGMFTVDFTGIENPNYDPSFPVTAPSYHLPQPSAYEPSNGNPTPLLDLPPSYDSVIREQKYSK